jgi:hypothetical protein
MPALRLRILSASANGSNSAPLSIGDLRGRVVLVDFWTYGCYNCVNTELTARLDRK